ncbi:MAG TPA: hypothetical protein VFC46_08175 [Humisphaera sp.]|nr:hypothetical protein [Humisphaera sp.]
MSRVYRKPSLSSRFIHIAICGAGLFTAGAALPPAANPPAGEVPAQAEPTLMELAVARYQAADQGYRISMSGHKPTEAPGYDALDWMRRRLNARLAIAEPKADRVAFLKEFVDQLRLQETVDERMVKSRLGSTETLLRIRYDRIDGEILLRQTEAK